MMTLFPGTLLVLAMALGSADLTGRWTLTLDPDFSGNPDTLDCALKQEGAALTVDCGGGPPFSGEVKDRNVTLQLKTGENGQVTAKLTGVLDRAETTISGSWHLDPDNTDGRFQLRKR